MTEPAIKPVVRATVVEAVTEQLRAQILSGGFRPGSRLPSERDLAERLGVNRLTLRAALARLEALGLIVIQHGTGSTVRDYREHGGIESLPKLLTVTREEDPARHQALARDVLELRRVLTAEAVALAAERRTPADLEAMREAAAAQAGRTSDPVEFARGDLVFARAVVRAAHNLGFELLLNTIARVPDEHPALARAMYPHPRTQAQHYAAIIGLIEAGDAALAREATRVALEALDRVTLARLARSLRPAGGAARGGKTTSAVRAGRRNDDSAAAGPDAHGEHDDDDDDEGGGG